MSIYSLYFLIYSKDANAVNVRKVLKWLLYYVLGELNAPTDTKPEEELTNQEYSMVQYRLNDCVNCGACELEWNGTFDESFNYEALQATCPVYLFDEEYNA